MLENKELSIDLIDASRFAVAIREAIDCIDRSASCYGLRKKAYYLEVKEYLTKKAEALEAPTARMYGKRE